MNRLPRTVRLDASDASVFARAALPGEWAVAGGFMFMELADDVLSVAEHYAFACGFLAVESFGWSTLVSVEPATEAEIAGVIDALAQRFLAQFGAPAMSQAREMAEQEVQFASGLCAHPVGTLLTVTRRFEVDGIVERYATLTPHDALAGVHASPIDVRALAAAGEPT